LATIDPVQSPPLTDGRTRSAYEAIRRRNVLFFLLDTAAFMFALSLIDLSSVIPTLFGHLTTQPFFIGLLGMVQPICWLLPQLLVARSVTSLPRKLPLVIYGTGVSRCGWLVLLAALLDPGLPPGAVMLAAYVAIAIFWTFDGLAVLAWFDVIARAVPPHLRGRMFGLMALSGIFGVGGGFVVERVLGSADFPFPSDYRLLLAIALVFFAVGIIPLFLVVEPPSESVPEPTEPLGQYLRRLPGLWRDRHNFRRLVTIQLLLGMATLAIPFYAPFGVTRLGLPESSIGTFVIGLTVGSTAGGVLWGYLGDRGLKDVAIRWIAFAGLLAPTLALSLRFFAPMLPPEVVSPLLALCMFFVGCSTRSNWVAFSSYVMEISEPRERPVLIGLMNTLNSVLAFAPPLGGLIAGWAGYEATFVVTLIPIAAGLIISFGLRMEQPTPVPA
jgi:Major Facilitator Superfamily